jgi:pimeloyl-ACP methyl ester carboxylesterase
MLRRGRNHPVIRCDQIPAWLHSPGRLGDRHGCGLSDRSRTDFTAEDDMLDLRAVIDAVGADKFDILGDSWGSQPAIVYTAGHPERVRRLVLHGPLVHFSGLADADQTVRRTGAERFFAERGAALAALRRRADLELYVRTIGMLFFPSGADDETFWSFVRIHHMAATIDMQESLDAVHFDVESLLDTIKTPTLVVQKRGDRVCPFAIGPTSAMQVDSRPFRGRQRWRREPRHTSDGSRLSPDHRRSDG